MIPIGYLALVLIIKKLPELNIKVGLNKQVCVHTMEWLDNVPTAL